jgi:hypothetical protein
VKTKTEESINISAIEIRNYKGIKEVVLKLKDLTVISGQNRQGKTSFIDSFQAALKGSTNPYDVRLGEDKATIYLALDNGIRVNRTIRKSGTQDVSIEKGDMAVRKKPQTFLDSLGIGNLNFNPLSWLDPKHDKKADLLNMMDIRVTKQELLNLGLSTEGVDLDQHGLKAVEELDTIYSTERRKVGKEAKKTQAVLDEVEKKYQDQFGHFDPEADFSTYHEKRKGTEAKIRQVETDRARMQAQAEEKGRWDKQRDEKTHEIEDIEKQIKSLPAITPAEVLNSMEEEQKRLKKRLAELEEDLRLARENAIEHTRLETELGRLKTDLAAIPDIQVDTEKLGRADDVLTQLNDHLKRYDNWVVQADLHQRVMAARKDHAETYAKWEQLDKQVKTLHGLPAQLIAKADIPIPGLSFADNKVLVDGKDIDNLSGREKVKIALDIVKRVNQKFKFICVDNFEQLDKTAQEGFIKMVQGDGYRYVVAKIVDMEKNKKGQWIPKPGPDEVYIENGEVQPVVEEVEAFK